MLMGLNDYDVMVCVIDVIDLGSTDVVNVQVLIDVDVDVVDAVQADDMKS